MCHEQSKDKKKACYFSRLLQSMIPAPEGHIREEEGEIKIRTEEEDCN